MLCPVLEDQGPFAALSLQVSQWTKDIHACGNASNNYTTWPGIICDGVYGNVIGIGLQGKGLAGTLPESLGLLTFLHQL